MLTSSTKRIIKRVLLGFLIIGLFTRVLTAPKSSDEKSLNNDNQESSRTEIIQNDKETNVVEGKKEEAEEQSDLIDINSASKVELMNLPGIGKKLAERIIAHRKQYPFGRKEDILFVKGIGPAKFRKIENLISINHSSK